MTYIDAAMRGIRIDKKLLAPEEQERLKGIIRELLIRLRCPGNIWKGAPGDPDKEEPRNWDGGCDECWAQEMEVRK